MTTYDAVVLAGGAARRLDGADKPALRVGGRSLLDRVLAACADAGRTVVVGPRRPTARPVRWAREEPAGGGPLPALAAGLAALAEAAGPDASGSDHSGSGVVGSHVAGSGAVAGPDTAGAGAAGPATASAAVPARSAPGLDAAPAAAGTGVAGAGRHPSEVVLVLAADLPFLTPDTVEALVTALTGPAPEPRGGWSGADGEGVMLTDGDGRDQPLVAAYRIEPLRRELALLRAEHGTLTGLPLRMLTGELAVRTIADPTGSASFDCDTWEDVAAARARPFNASEG